MLLTPTPVGPCALTVSYAYPNPVQGSHQRPAEVKFDLYSPCPVTVDWVVFTAAKRRVYSDRLTLNGAKTIVWNVKDRRGSWMSNSTYFVKFSVEGQEPQFRKVTVLR